MIFTHATNGVLIKDKSEEKADKREQTKETG
jgi:hypothetical protein